MNNISELFYHILVLSGSFICTALAFWLTGSILIRVTDIIDKIEERREKRKK